MPSEKSGREFMDCERTVVARCEVGCVDVCVCGTVGVHLGNASVRIPREAFLGFCRMMDDAFAVVTEQETRVCENEPTPPEARA
jgi:hypothetical protein